MLATQLECNLNATKHALKLAKKHRITTLLNPAPMRDDFPLGMLEDVDILIPNETELAHLVRTRFPKDRENFSETDIASMDPESLHRLCRKFEIPAFIITLGSRGSFCSTRDTFFHTPALTGIEVLDTTGAGDAFVGGLASGLKQFDGDLHNP